MATRVAVHLAHRDKPVLFTLTSHSAEETNESWRKAVAAKASTFNFTDKDGREIALTVSRVDMLVAMDIKEAE
ncbi:hypothetical protein SEA_PEPPERWOOD_265 [Streptomyces phage Pepperwood]|uniref:Uncharacterized protein n=4 Tax=Samistivirus TaxID=2560220 RepID=A0A222YX79_9CAUD|nr:hypothetical protein FDI38_gp015 [Streptomyces phage Peebs]YP_009611431.1 hypothetical protein FDI38_gp045 [Streptomyces phage Peebs]YP_010101437.1 hypothetical protein KNU49_gp015 [Streptomyces phage EGole]YP_010101643.1 hypothetical protein KNU49_gp045 [Streptomyces phage EGole]ASR76449.1 hypothetical protein SEA_SUSHI23_16 [Streptomyces phage Sushi23]QRI46012.1 hypothetical protein SEA_CROSS_15 [Streptomyces phage Cross]WDS51813.1 hypothetical protein SEA_PEPPERWOOD_16 [Streptomyces pha